MSVKNVISWHSAFTCSFGTLSPGLKSYLVHQVVKWEKSTPITPWWPTLKTKNKVIFWISLRILHQISVTAKKLITCFKQFDKLFKILTLTLPIEIITLDNDYSFLIKSWIMQIFIKLFYTSIRLKIEDIVIENGSGLRFC